MTRSEILETARKCVCGEREQDYGTPENNFETIGHLWSIYLNAAHPEWEMKIESITAKDVGMMMALLKVARIATGTSLDSFVDLAGYAACAGEICGKCFVSQSGTDFKTRSSAVKAWNRRVK